MTEELSVHDHIRLFHDPYAVVGSLEQPCGRWPPQRRDCWCYLDVHHLLVRPLPDQYVHGRDGLHVRELCPYFVYITPSWTVAYHSSSRAPTVGGQYHWVSEFAPRKHQRFLSYLMGWLCVLGWQVSCASAAYTTATQLQGLIVLNCPDTYVSEYWHGTLMTIAFAAFSVVFNTLFARKLPLLEGIVLVIHICAFIAFIVTLWVLAPIGDAKAVFTEFNDGGGWGDLGVSTLVGITGSTLPLLGADAAVHMSEELQDASRTLPRTMIWSTVLNGLMGWVMIITFCFALGNLDEVLASPTGYPYIQVCVFLLVDLSPRHGI